MPALEYQTFPSINRVFVGADALISAKYGTSSHPHVIGIRDRAQDPVVELFLTTDALVVLQSRINAILDDPAEVASWASRQIEPVA